MPPRNWTLRIQDILSAIERINQYTESMAYDAFCIDRPIATEIRRIRLERAKRDVAQTKRPLAKISRDVGFGGGTTMYKVFRRELKMTPREYRKQRTK